MNNRTRIAEELAHELDAPVGLWDGEGHCWTARARIDEGDLPAATSQFEEVIGSVGLRQGRTALWRCSQTPEITWMVIPMPSREAGRLVGFAGFETYHPNRGLGAASSDRGGLRLRSPVQGKIVIAWGPPCPEPALRAWGMQIVERFQHAHDSRIVPGPVARVDGEEQPESEPIGRLIRRMRISESPARFQALATSVLQSTLGFSATALVPADPGDQEIVSGEIDGITLSSFRKYIPNSPRESSYVVRDFTSSRKKGDDCVRRFATVPAGPSAWLVAINPNPDRPIEPSDIEQMRHIATLIATQASNARTYAELKELLFGIIRALAAAIDAKDPYTLGHSERVARISVRLAEQVGMPAQKRSDLYLAGLLHDVGKIGIDDHVLKKAGPLTPDEQSKIQQHVEIGVTILKDLKKLHHILPGVRHHHESVDGSGYPDHLVGDSIPREARILAVADAFDAMSSDRPYRKRLSPSRIDEIFHQGRGVQWDSEIVDALFECRMDLEEIRQKGLGESLVGAVNVTLGRG